MVTLEFGIVLNISFCNVMFMLPAKRTMLKQHYDYIYKMLSDNNNNRNENVIHCSLFHCGYLGWHGAWCLYLTSNKHSGAYAAKVTIHLPNVLFKLSNSKYVHCCASNIF